MQGGWFGAACCRGVSGAVGGQGADVVLCQEGVKVEEDHVLFCLFLNIY